MIRSHRDLPLDRVMALAALARSEGYSFVDRLIEEWRSGTTRFDGPGEHLIGDFEAEHLIAIGALHRDPYAGHTRIGRLRRFYVAPVWRRSGRGRLLIQTLLDAGRNDFDIVRLRVPGAAAARFYEAIGFCPVYEPNCSHIIASG